MYQAIVFVAVKSKAGRREVAAENSHLRLQVLVKSAELQMQLHGAPQAQLGFLRITGTHQQVQSGTVALKQIGGNMCADVSGRSSQEYRHVAPLVPVFTASPFAGAS